jgi:hypothetical protein
MKLVIEISLYILYFTNYAGHFIDIKAIDYLDSPKNLLPDRKMDYRCE